MTKANKTPMTRSGSNGLMEGSPLLFFLIENSETKLDWSRMVLLESENRRRC